MQDQTKKLQDSFLKVIVKECSIFFYNLHKFCLEYEKKIGSSEVPKKEKKTVQEVEKKKKIKKPNKSPYLRFFIEFKNNLKKQNSTQKLDGRQLSRMASRQWKLMSASEKQIFKTQSNNEIKETKKKANSKKQNNVQKKQ